ncbi:hypothetical protein HLI03_13980 [Rhizobium laguerreae]|uniref:hypothetical protein n=1 Tax=Rhizobium TaxID=379 RepID=UPI001479494C|nr:MULTISPECIES: hypothetical protein [Rhizobium]MBW8788153.1 hypothetical protein [Rhizobium leguminosarum]NNH42752.1 hypothetical protein [Rhizobium laguerreae]UWM78668.1 hypothetical protein N1937_26585 [Rhizobium leguminosarum bv. viciae]
MPPRKSTATKTLDTTGAKIGEPVPKAIIDTNTASVGVPRQAESDLQEDLSALRKQIDALQQRVANAAQSAKGNAGDAMRQTQAAVKHHPVSTLVVVAAVCGALALIFTGRRAEPPRRYRYRPALDELREFYDSVRDRL